MTHGSPFALLALTLAAVLPVRASDGLELPGILPWTISTDVRTAVGYKDNVLLSADAPEGSLLFRADVDVLLMRLPESLTVYDVFISGSETRFPAISGDGAAERIWLGRAEWRYDIGTLFKWVLAGQAIYQDRVLDLSSLEVGVLRARVKVLSCSIGPQARLEFTPHWWIESSVGARMDTFQGLKENFDEPAIMVRLGRKLGPHFDLSATYTRRRREYWDRPEYTMGGRPITGTHLVVGQQEEELRCVTKWGGKEPKLTFTVRAAAAANRDGGSGYFDFEQKRASAEVKWTTGAWTLTGEVRHTRYDYAQQTVGVGFDPAKRALRDTKFAARLERKLSEGWTAFADGQWEQSSSNDPGTSYRVASAMLGFDREF